MEPAIGNRDVKPTPGWRGCLTETSRQIANSTDRETASDWAVPPAPYMMWSMTIEEYAMRLVVASVLTLGLLVTPSVSARAATVHRPLHPRVHRHVFVPAPTHGEIAPHFAVPGWSDGDTERWLDNASSGWSHA